MKILHHLLGILMAFALMIVLLISSIEIVAYHIPGYYAYEYQKYRVTDTVDIEMTDLLQVTDEMMLYLRGERNNLIDIQTTISGVEGVHFFNEREALHMADVRHLFISAIYLRIFLCIFIFLSLLFCKLTKAKLRYLIPKSIFIGAGLFFILFTALSLLIASDFPKYFVIFHEIFFTNDLWLLDPRTDNLINIVPQGFFMDTARNIALVYAFFVFLSIILASIYYYKTKRNTYES